MDIYACIICMYVYMKRHPLFSDSDCNTIANMSLKIAA